MNKIVMVNILMGVVVGSFALQCTSGANSEDSYTAALKSQSAANQANGNRKVFTRLPNGQTGAYDIGQDASTAVPVEAVAPSVSPQPIAVETEVVAVPAPVIVPPQPVEPSSVSVAPQQSEAENAAAPLEVASAPANVPAVAPVADGSIEKTWRFENMVISFQNGRYSGNTGCNDFQGNYVKWFGGKIQITGVKFLGNTCDSAEVVQSEIRLEEEFPGRYEVIFDGPNLLLSNDKSSWLFAPAS